MRSGAAILFRTHSPMTSSKKFSPLSSRRTLDSNYRLPLIFSMSLPIRANVHRSVAYPCTSRPALSTVIKCFFSASVSYGGRPVRGAWRSASRPTTSRATSASPGP